MIKIERTSVMNFDNAIRGARNPMNSWAKSDSYYDENGKFVMGEADLAFGKRLVTAGPDHRKFIRQIFVSVDITAPLYWWKELDTYKVGTVANSCSTMHKIHAKEFELGDFSHDRMSRLSISHLGLTIHHLNGYRLLYVNWDDVSDETKSEWLAGAELSETGEYTKKMAWDQMIQLLPTSYNQMRTVTMNYENLINIYNARCTHKLDEWHRLCEWILTLPYADDLLVPALRQTKE